MEALAEEKQVKKKQNAPNLTEGPFLKKIIAFIIPLIATGLLQSLYNAADLAVVGRFDGELALAAVGSTGSLTNLILGLFMGLSVGAGVMVAHRMGAKEYKGVEQVVHTAALLSVILGVIVAVIGFFIAPLLLSWMDTPDTVIGGATLYLRIILCGAPGSLLYNYCASMLRSTGDTKRPLLFLTVSGLLNVALNLLLVIGFGMGVAGVAIGTIASQYLSAAMIVVYMVRSNGVMRLSFSKLHIHRRVLGQMMYIGIPSGIQGVLFALSNVIIQSSVNYFGDIVVAGNATSSNLEHFNHIAMTSVYQASLTFVGQNVGAKRYQNIKKVVGNCLLCVTVIGLGIGGILLLFRNFFVGLYISDGAAMEAAITRMLWVLPLHFTCGTMDVLCGAVRGMGKSVTSMVISLLGVCAFRIVWIKLFFAFSADPRIDQVYMSYPVSWIIVNICSALFLLYYYRKLVRSDGECNALQ